MKEESIANVAGHPHAVYGQERFQNAAHSGILEP